MVALVPPDVRRSGDPPPATPMVTKGAVNVRETSPVKPPTLVRVSVVVLAAFWNTVSDAGDGAIEKFGTATTMIVTVAVWDFVPPVAVRVTV